MPAFKLDYMPPRPPAASAVGMVLAAGAAVVALWFLYQVVGAILLIFFAAVVAVALSAPVHWFVRRGLGFHGAAVLTLTLFLATMVIIGALVIPRLVAQIVLLANGLPGLIGQVQAQLNELLASYPDLQRFARIDGGGGGGADFVPAAVNIFRGVGAFSLSLLAFLALVLIFFSTVAYIVLDPMPIVRGYVRSLPFGWRPAGVRAYRRSVVAIIGWAKASLLVGAIQAVAVFFFLSYMDIEGALVWAALAFFADFIPRIGGYVMAFPPVILALGDGPMAAIWVIVFYVASNEVLGSIVAPRIRGTAMQVHPVLIIFFTVAFALAFGLLGAIVATPAAAVASAFYGEFYLKRPPRRMVVPV